MSVQDSSKNNAPHKGVLNYFKKDLTELEQWVGQETNPDEAWQEAHKWLQMSPGYWSENDIDSCVTSFAFGSIVCVILATLIFSGLMWWIPIETRHALFGVTAAPLISGVMVLLVHANQSYKKYQKNLPRWIQFGISEKLKRASHDTVEVLLEYWGQKKPATVDDVHQVLTDCVLHGFEQGQAWIKVALQSKGFVSEQMLVEIKKDLEHQKQKKAHQAQDQKQLEIVALLGLEDEGMMGKEAVASVEEVHQALKECLLNGSSLGCQWLKKSIQAKGWVSEETLLSVWQDIERQKQKQEVPTLSQKKRTDHGHAGIG